jgi:IS5 family transposase
MRPKQETFAEASVEKYRKPTRREDFLAREFVGIDLRREPVPDETTICKFRHWLQAHALGKQVLATANAHLASEGY